MYDTDTATLIRSTPELEGLDREALPELFSDTFAKLSAARIRLRSSTSDDAGEILSTIEETRRLAYTNEALVSVLSPGKDRRAAAFVAATAYSLVFNAERLVAGQSNSSSLDARSVSSDIAAMLLFLIAEASADAADIASIIRLHTEEPIERALILSLKDLARGNLVGLTNRSLPNLVGSSNEKLGPIAVQALYLRTFEGVQALASQLLDGDAYKQQEPAIGIFEHVFSLSIGPGVTISDEWEDDRTTCAFAGPHHLASLLIALARDLGESSIVSIPTPAGLAPAEWRSSLQRIARSRPYLWRNHREAIERGYLKSGVSAAIGFPTGAGKSTLAELKINATLLADRKVVFLAPTHALVDQTSGALARSFPTTSVLRDNEDQLSIQDGEDERQSEIMVMTPESCLAQMSIDASVFEDVGLFIFDECHLLHPRDTSDRRAIDAMLCVLNFSNIAGDADFLLLSAMMKNSDDIAGWIEELSGRQCLSLALPWKPTRQLRGSVVYREDAVAQLKEDLAKARTTATTKAPNVAVKRSLQTKPLALFSLKQTWETNNRGDYALVSLLDDSVTLAASKYWKLTPNAVAVSSTIAAASAEAGVKTLVFFQTIKNAASAAKKIAELLPPISVKLKDRETEWLDRAISELGGDSHAYIEAENGCVIEPTSVHHGLLLPEERYVCESLYKRNDGIKVLTATSTLAQGMNLPSELVIIGEDSRFNRATEKREILEAQELLNAAGRAGRAGENATGIVLVVPGKVVGIDFDEATIGAHWSDLREIFGQSDQCLEIDDPLTAVLDRVHVATDQLSSLERYTLNRLVSGRDASESEPVAGAIKGTFGAFMARKRQDADWINERIATAAAFLGQDDSLTEREIAESQVAASLGLSVELVSRLSLSLETAGPEIGASITEWRSWMFRWLTENPEMLEQVFRRPGLMSLVGETTYIGLETDDDKAGYVLPILQNLTTLWMSGEPLCDLQKALGTAPQKLKKCLRARLFAIRIVPELSYFLGLPAFLHERAEAVSDNPDPLPSALGQLGRCTRLGVDLHEKAALNQFLRDARLARRGLHEHYVLIEPFLGAAPDGEIWEQTLARVEHACELELHSRNF